MFFKVAVVVLLQQPTDGLELRVLRRAHELKEEGLGGGEAYVGGVAHGLQRDSAIVCPE